MSTKLRDLILISITISGVIFFWDIGPALAMEEGPPVLMFGYPIDNQIWEESLRKNAAQNKVAYAFIKELVTGFDLPYEQNKKYEGLLFLSLSDIDSALESHKSGLRDYDMKKFQEELNAHLCGDDREHSLITLQTTIDLIKKIFINEGH